MGRRDPVPRWAPWADAQPPAGADSRASSTVGPSYQGASSERRTTLSPRRAEMGMTVHDVMPRRRASASHVGRDPSKVVLVPVDQVHLVGHDDQLVDPEEGGDAGVAPRLLAQAGRGVHDHEGEVGRRAPGGHVARVLHVARAVGDDELAVRRGRVAVGDVDRDALLALGAQPVGDEGQVHVVDAAAPRRQGDGLELVVEELAGVEEEAPDQRRLAVVDRSDGGESQEVSRRRGTVGRRCGRRPGGRIHSLEVSLALSVLHRRSPRTGRRRGWHPVRTTATWRSRRRSLRP